MKKLRTAVPPGVKRHAVVILVWMTTATAYAEPNDLKVGERAYNTTCFACHGKDGKGAIPGVPNMRGPESPLHQDYAVLHKHVREGYQSKGSPMAMPPKGGNPNLTDDQIKSVIAYMKATFLKKKQ